MFLYEDRNSEYHRAAVVRAKLKCIMETNTSSLEVEIDGSL